MDYDKVYTAGWKDAMEEMEGKLAEEKKNRGDESNSFNVA